MTQTPNASADVFANEDISELIAKAGIDARDLTTWSCTRPAKARSTLRLVHQASRRRIDALCETYEDMRLNSFDRASDVLTSALAPQAAAALQLFPGLHSLRLEGLDSEMLEHVLSSLSSGNGAPSRLRDLNLARGTFERLPLPPVWAGLTALDLGGCGALGDAALEEAVGAAPRLERLRLTMNAKLCVPRLTCPRLLSVSMSICAHLEDAAVDALVAGAPLLQELCLWRCASLRAPKVAAPRLHALNYSDCFELSDAAVEAACEHCPELIKLQLAGCNGLRAPRALGGGGIQTLDLSDLRHIEDAVLTAAVARCPRLSRLDCSGCAALHSPAIGGHHLRALLLSRCDELSDEAVSRACARSPGLTSLVLSLCPALCLPRCYGLELLEANLSGCSGLRDEAVELLCFNSPRLVRVGLSLCTALTAPCVRGVSLEKVDLAHCDHLTAPHIYGPHLTEIGLAGCSRLGDAALEELCGGCPALRRLNICGCLQLRSPRIESRSLEALNCELLPPEIVASVNLETCPSLKRIKSS